MLSRKVSKVKQPTLILWGREDKILDLDFANKLESELPNSKLVWVEQCGHAAFMEKPRDVAQAIFEFFEIQ